MTSWNKQHIGTLLLTAAQKAIALQENLVAKEKGTEQSLYTDGDIIIEQFFAEKFNDPHNHTYFIGEESISEYIQTHSRENIFTHNAYIVDPIDGTLNYFNKLPGWAISIGLLQDGEITNGAVILPELRELIISENKSVYYAKFSQAIEHMQITDTIAFKRLSHIPIASYASKHTLFACSYISSKKMPNNRFPYHVNRSSVFSATKVLLGNYWGYKSSAHIWDLAGCIGLFRAMNKPIYYIRNEQLHLLPYTVNEEYWKDFLTARYPIIFAHSEEHAQRFIYA